MTADPSPDLPVAAARPNNLVGLGVLAAFLAAGWGLGHGVAVGPLSFVFIMLGWTLSVMAHEFAHALTAYAGGDHTVRAKGYLAFDPRRYGDLGSSLILPLLILALGGIGFPGGAVYLRNDLMRGPVWRAAAALAGPFATLLVLLLLTVVLRTWGAFDVANPLYPALTFLAFLQATALILNLLPLPGLDGFGAIRPFLPDPYAPWLRQAEGLAMALLFVAVFVTPWAGTFLFGTGARIIYALGLSPQALYDGYRNFHFWR